MYAAGNSMTIHNVLCIDIMLYIMPVILFVVPGNGYCCVKGMVQMLLLVDDNNAVVM